MAYKVSMASVGCRSPVHTCTAPGKLRQKSGCQFQASKRDCVSKKKKKGVSVAVVVVAGEIGSKILAA